MQASFTSHHQYRLRQKKNTRGHGFHRGANHEIQYIEAIVRLITVTLCDLRTQFQ